MMAPPLAGSPRVHGHRDYVIKTLLHGLTGPLDGKTYTGRDDADGREPRRVDAAIASYVRNSFGNARRSSPPADVARVRAATADRKTLWTPERARGVAAARCWRSRHVEGDREPQRRERRPAA